MTGIVDDTEDSDVSLLVVNGNEENTDGDDGNDDATLTVSSNVLSDATASNPVSETAIGVTCPDPGATTHDVAMVTRSDTVCSRPRRHSHRHHRSAAR